jgi:hypothetical protein
MDPALEVPSDLHPLSSLPSSQTVKKQMSGIMKKITNIEKITNPPNFHGDLIGWCMNCGFRTGTEPKNIISFMFVSNVFTLVTLSMSWMT